MLAGITPKCWILALVVRDDGERLLLGDGAFEFKEKQQHFIANNYVNDTVEVQGNDGIMLAGQVRRSASQPFDGFIADATVGGTDTETYRRQFLAFFRKNHYYTVIYIMPDGSAVKRQRGFIVDAPEVKELFRISPEYHVSLNFEDVNYYEYDENSEGEEIYSDSASIPMVNANSGGLVWDEYGVVWDGVTYNITGLLGDTFQQTPPNPDYPQDIQTVRGQQTITIGDNDYAIDLTSKNLFDGDFVQGTYNSHGSPTSSSTQFRNTSPIQVSGGDTYTFSSSTASAYDLFMYDSDMNYLGYGYTTKSYTLRNDAAFLNFATSGTLSSAPTDMQVEKGSAKTSYTPYYSPIELCKIGTYQDRIYKDNNKWWLEKKIGKTTEDGTTAGIYVSSGSIKMINIPNTLAMQGQSSTLFSTHFIFKWAVEYGACYVSSSYQAIVCGVNGVTDNTSAISWLSQNKPTFYYILNTPTTTEITDANLLAQLEAVNAELLESQTDASVAGSLPAILSFIGSESGTGGAVWDGDGGGGTATVTVDSIDNVYPVLTITGPANNPTVENVTTQTSIAYAGNLIEGQELVIDMNVQTAKLNGANVIGDISGDWLYFAPGDNKVAYATSNNDAPEATIEWSEVVG